MPHVVFSGFFFRRHFVDFTGAPCDYILCSRVGKEEEGEQGGGSAAPRVGGSRHCITFYKLSFQEEETETE